MTLIELHTGKVIIANRSLFSIGKYGETFELYEGYTTFIPLINKEGEPDFTKDELIEIAESIIKSGQDFIFAINNGDVKYISESNKKIDEKDKND